MEEPKRQSDSPAGPLLCDSCKRGASSVHILPDGDAPVEVVVACDQHDPGGEWWVLTEKSDLERLWENQAVLERLRPGLTSRLPTAALDQLNEDGTKTCPECAEHVQGAALVCRFCGHRFDEHPAERQDASEREGGTLVGLGYLLAVLVPFVGLVLGIIAATRSALYPRKHGPWIIAVATLAFVGWGAVIYAEVHSSEHHAVVQAEEKVEQVRQEQAKDQSETEEKEKEAAQEASEKQYCAEHPGAGEHTAADGYHYYGCTPEMEEP